MKRLLGYCWLAAGLCGAAEINLPRVSVPPGGSVNAEVRFTALGSPVTGVQFDVESNPDLTIAAVEGQAATAAGKTLSTADRGGNRTRYVISGLNQTALGDGALAAVAISVKAGAAAAVIPLKIFNVMASDKDGNLVPVAANDGSVAVGTPNVLPFAGAFAHLASGGTWKTSLVLVNQSSTPTAFRLGFWADDGSELTLPVTLSWGMAPVGVRFSFVNGVIPASGTYVVESEAPATGPILTGWAELSSAGDVTGYAIFRQRLQSGRDAEAVVPFENRNRAAYLMPFDDTSEFMTGMALANLSSSGGATVNIVVRDAAGNQFATDSVPIPLHGHTAYVLRTRLPVVAGRRGTVEFRNSADGNLAVLGLRFNQSATFATVPVVATK